MQPKYEYRRRLPHYQKDDHPLFVTFNTDRRWKLSFAARDIVLDCCLKQNGNKFNLQSCPSDLLTTSPRRWLELIPARDHEVLKGRAGCQINAALKRTGPVWQEVFFDHVLRSNDSLMDRVEYVCRNPVRAGIVKTEAEYA